jgi:hypothetical protein
MRPAMQSDQPLDLAVFESLEPRLELLVEDLLWWARALSTARGV